MMDNPSTYYNCQDKLADYVMAEFPAVYEEWVYDGETDLEGFLETNYPDILEEFNDD